MNCDCNDWKENIAKVDAPLLLQAARSGFNPAVQYDGVKFRYCPWCSNPLKESVLKGADSVVNTSAAGAAQVIPNSTPAPSLSHVQQMERDLVRDLAGEECIYGPAEGDCGTPTCWRCRARSLLSSQDDNSPATSVSSTILRRLAVEIITMLQGENLNLNTEEWIESVETTLSETLSPVSSVERDKKQDLGIPGGA